MPPAHRLFLAPRASWFARDCCCFIDFIYCWLFSKKAMDLDSTLYSKRKARPTIQMSKAQCLGKEAKERRLNSRLDLL